MAKVLTDNKHYTDIANAIREKNGTEDTYKPSEMADAITAIVSGGGGDVPEEAFDVGGTCSYMFANQNWDWFMDFYKNRIKTNGLMRTDYMFYNSWVKSIPFELNFKTDYSGYNMIANMFFLCKNITEIPKINNCTPESIEGLFTQCERIRYLPEDIESWFNWSYMESRTNTYTGSQSKLFYYCHSLRSVPVGFLSHVNPNISYSSSYFYSGFNNCGALDELIDLPLPWTATWTGNTFSNTFTNCYRLKNLTFAMPNGQPYIKQWKNQIIDLTKFTGWAYTNNMIVNYNSGITSNKEVEDDETYQALKDDPDWFACTMAYSRYNHDSAVATINSLPDTSAYLATAGSTNTIKFQGTAGSATDGGAINTLTEEEIAVATAKGWTVTMV